MPPYLSTQFKGIQQSVGLSSRWSRCNAACKRPARATECGNGSVKAPAFTHGVHYHLPLLLPRASARARGSSHSPHHARARLRAAARPTLSSSSNARKPARMAHARAIFSHSEAGAWWAHGWKGGWAKDDATRTGEPPRTAGAHVSPPSRLERRRGPCGSPYASPAPVPAALSAPARAAGRWSSSSDALPAPGAGPCRPGPGPGPAPPSRSHGYGRRCGDRPGLGW